MGKSKVLPIFFLLGLFFLTAGGSFFLFKTLKASPTVVATDSSPNVSANPTGKKSKIDPSIPRTEVCPLNGAMFTKQEKDAWSVRRPLAVMIENSVDARPQSGLSTADVVYEAVAEGGITRFMGVFLCNAALAGNVTLAPVRSARIYFVNLMSEYDAIYNHVGGAGNCDDPNVDPRAKALCLLKTAKLKDLDQFGLDFKTCHRLTNRLDKEVAYEHTMACFLDELYNVAAKRGWTNVDEKGVPWDKNFTSWKFKSSTEKATNAVVSDISYVFWGHNRDFNSAFDVSWKYDLSSNAYVRYNGGQQSVDLNTNEPLKFNTVIVQFVKETNTGDLEKHMLYDVIGTNKALVFTDGLAIEGTWAKSSRTSRTVFKDKSGKEIQFTPGPVWISVVPDTNTVSYK